MLLYEIYQEDETGIKGMVFTDKQDYDLFVEKLKEE